MALKPIIVPAGTTKPLPVSFTMVGLTRFTDGLVTTKWPTVVSISNDDRKNWNCWTCAMHPLGLEEGTHPGVTSAIDALPDVRLKAELAPSIDSDTRLLG